MRLEFIFKGVLIILILNILYVGGYYLIISLFHNQWNSADWSTDAQSIGAVGGVIWLIISTALGIIFAIDYQEIYDNSKI